MSPTHPLPESFCGYLVQRDASGLADCAWTNLPIADLPAGEVLLRVAYSSLNYKDALAYQGHPGVIKACPMVPGVDAVGTVVQSGSYEFVPGDQVLVTGFDMGMTHWGGWAQYVRVPEDWLLPLPANLTLYESMIFGSAGLTAGLCVDTLQKHGVLPDKGPVVVTGSTGGVGSLAVAVLARLGYQVAAVTGKTSAHDYLRRLGASEILGRDQVDDASGKPLLSGRWSGAIDTVGGNTLGTLLRSMRHSACVAACGLAASPQLPTTVYPFILRAITLAGIDAAWCPMAWRHQVWLQLAGPWRPPLLAEIARDCQPEDLPRLVPEILAGRVQGRYVVCMHPESEGQETGV